MGQWYFARHGQQHGPVEEQVLTAYLQSGQLQLQDHVWTEGMDDWKPAAMVEPFMHVTAAPAVAPVTAPQSGKAIASMICSISGIFVCMFVGQIIGLVLGYSARREIRASQGRIGGAGFATAGIVIGWIGIVIDALMLVVWTLILVASAASSP